MPVGLLAGAQHGDRVHARAPREEQRGGERGAEGGQFGRAEEGERGARGAEQGESAPRGGGLRGGLGSRRGGSAAAERAGTRAAADDRARGAVGRAARYGRGAGRGIGGGTGKRQDFDPGRGGSAGRDEERAAVLGAELDARGLVRAAGWHVLGAGGVVVQGLGEVALQPDDVVVTQGVQERADVCVGEDGEGHLESRLCVTLDQDWTASRRGISCLVDGARERKLLIDAGIWSTAYRLRSRRLGLRHALVERAYRVRISTA